MTRYVDLVLAEAELWADARTQQIKPHTVFFGGGTPTLLPAEQMLRLIAGLRQRLDLSDVVEWTTEANPATVDLEYCAMLPESGVDRISFGAQSFDRRELATLERHHDPEDVPASVDVARQAGFSRINVDLIYAIPGQDLASWSRSLDQAIALNTSHLSCYGLTYEPNTPIAVKKRLGTMQPAPESLELEMFRHAAERLSTAGLDRYEISNYSSPGQECRHNLLYWTGGNYLGLGPSAASHIDGHRFKNRPHLGEWESAIESGQLPVTDVEVLSPAQRAGELAMLMLRLSRGIDFEGFARRTGHDARDLFASIIPRLHACGLLDVSDTRVRLTARGFEVADAVAQEFLHPRD
jgi:oxygen-independent coproporphyrinogen-3 oxidase